jgi:hypothetical protein
MIEILLGIWLICGLLSALLGILNLYLIHKKFKSAAFTQLNNHLLKANLFWSYTQGSCLGIDAVNSTQQDKKIALKQANYLFILTLFSLPGLIIILLALFGIHLLPPSRQEQEFFNSPLANTNNLNAEQVRLLVEELTRARFT